MRRIIKTISVTIAAHHTVTSGLFQCYCMENYSWHRLKRSGDGDGDEDREEANGK